jgi:hypothetical protein
MLGRVLTGLIVLCSIAMLLFVMGFIAGSTGWPVFMPMLYAIASQLMLLAFGLLLVTGLTALLRAIALEVAAYFAREARAKRRLWRLQGHLLQVDRLQRLKARQTRYFEHCKRQRLLVANHNKHRQALFHSIDHELQAIKPQLAATDYRRLQRALRHHHKRANAEAMLAVRKQFLAHLA